jgi:TonB family protein
MRKGVKPGLDFTMETDARRRSSSKQWLVIIMIAIVIHLFILFGLKPHYFNIFRRSIDNSEATSSRRASLPNAIVAVTVDVEGDRPVPVVIEEVPPEDKETEVSEMESRKESESEKDDILDILGASNSPRPSLPSTTSEVIPPRPIEITWPDTRDLGHCRDLHVDVRIEVGEDGTVLGVEAIKSDVPEECSDAALRAARHIVFLPGRVGGKPKTMWTEIRIDFRRNTR